MSLSGRSIYLLLGFGCSLLFAGLGQRALTQHEAFAAYPAKEMLQYGHWIVPMFAGTPRMTKPATTGWLIAGAMKVTGSDAEWVARLPAAASGVVSALLIAIFAARCKGELVGVITGLVQLTSFFTLMQARLAEADMIVCAAVTGAMVCLAYATIPGWRPETRSRWLSLGFYACAGIAFLLKAVPLIFIVLATLAWLIVRRDRRIGRFLLDPVGIAVLVLCVVAWPLAAWLTYPPIKEVWISELWRTPNDGLGRDPLYTYVLSIPGVLMPWFPFAVLAVVVAAVRARVSTSPDGPRGRSTWFSRLLSGHPLRQFVLCWFLPGVIVLHGIAVKHKHYPIPMLPPMSMLAAIGLLGYVRWQYEHAKPMHVLAAILWTIGLAAGGVVAWKVPAARVMAMEITAVLAVLWVGGLLAIYCERRKLLGWQLGAIFGTAWLVCTTVISVIIPRYFDDYRYARGFALRANTLIPPEVKLYIVDPEPKVDPQVCYYLRAPIWRYPTAQKFDEFARHADSSQPIYVVATQQAGREFSDVGRVSPILAAVPRKRERDEQKLVLYQILIGLEEDQQGR